MITYVNGNLLDATQKVIAHGCNAQGVQASGVAKQIRDKWPNVYEIYKLRHTVFGLDMGSIIPVATLDGKIIINCITQENYGRDNIRYVDYEAIESCMVKINDRVKDWNVSEIAMPRIGAGLGGGDWDIIEKIIIKSAKNFIPIIYDYNDQL